MKNRNEAGITGMDMVSGLVIFMLSAAVVASMYYQIYVTTVNIKIHQYALGCITDIFEKIDLANYDEIDNEKLKSLVDESNINDYFTEEKNNSSINYTIKNYKDETGAVQDLVKEVNISVVYYVGNKQMTLPMSKIKIREWDKDEE